MTQEQRIEYFMSEIARLSNQVVDLQDERDALAAQVEALRSQLQVAHDCVTCADETGYVQDVGFVDLEQVALEISRVLALTPQQHLAEIRAEAGRVGFVAGAVAMERRQVFTEDFNLSNAANQYADSIRQEGK